MTHRSLFLILAIALAFGLGCDEKKSDGEEKGAPEESAEKKEGSGMDAGKEYLLKSGQGNLKEVKAKKEAELETSDCVSVLHAAGELKGIKNADAEKFVKEAMQICGHDVQLAVAKQGAEKIKKIREEKPDEKFMSECTEVKISLENLDKYGHGEEEAVKEIKELHKKACE